VFFQESAMGAELLRKAGMTAALVIEGCASYPPAPEEVYEVSQLRVIFLDEEQIREKWHASRHTTGTGLVYQGRFKLFPVQSDEHFLAITRYVSRAALRAKLV
jgi:hypothetical protein